MCKIYYLPVACIKTLEGKRLLSAGDSFTPHALRATRINYLASGY